MLVKGGPGDKPLCEPMMGKLPTHICVTRPQWVKRRLEPYVYSSSYWSMVPNPVQWQYSKIHYKQRFWQQKNISKHPNILVGNPYFLFRLIMVRQRKQQALQKTICIVSVLLINGGYTFWGPLYKRPSIKIMSWISNHSHYFVWYVTHTWTSMRIN